jgi:uncharacterized membrane protein
MVLFSASLALAFALLVHIHRDRLALTEKALIDLGSLVVVGGLERALGDEFI